LTARIVVVAQANIGIVVLLSVNVTAFSPITASLNRRHTANFSLALTAHCSRPLSQGKAFQLSLAGP
jgi:hypothetical protein